MDVGQEVVDFGAGKAYTVEARVEPDDLPNREIGLEARRLKLDAHPRFRYSGICSGIDIADSDRAGVGSQQTPIALRVLVFPAPFGPSRPKISPSLMSRDTPSTARFGP